MQSVAHRAPQVDVAFPLLLVTTGAHWLGQLDDQAPDHTLGNLAQISQLQLTRFASVHRAIVPTTSAGGGPIRRYLPGVH